MRKFEEVMATTRVDAHGIKFTKDSLEAAAQQMQGRYIPLLSEHDVLQPLGRVSGASLRQASDGEWELVQTFEQLESSDQAVPKDPALEFVPLRPQRDALLVVVGPEFVRSPESKALVTELAAVSGQPIGFQGRRSLEPTDLIKITGVFALGQVASGFLQQLGADGYSKLKEAIHRLYKSRPRPDGERRLEIDLFFEREGVEVILVQAMPNQQGIEDALGRGLTELDAILPELIAANPDVRRVVAEYSEAGVRIWYVVGADCLPIAVHRVTRRPSQRQGPAE